MCGNLEKFKFDQHGAKRWVISVSVYEISVPKLVTDKCSEYTSRSNIALAVADPADDKCKSFIECRHGKFQKRAFCHNGEIFDPINSLCKPPSKVSCGNSTNAITPASIGYQTSRPDYSTSQEISDNEKNHRDDKDTSSNKMDSIIYGAIGAGGAALLLMTLAGSWCFYRRDKTKQVDQ